MELRKAVPLIFVPCFYWIDFSFGIEVVSEASASETNPVSLGERDVEIR